MMTRRIRPLVSGLLIAFLIPLVISGQPTAAVIFHEGLMLERSEGKLPEAVSRYERVVAEFPSDRDLVAKALLQLGGGYEKLGRPGAKEAYERIVRDFADIAAVASDARARLATYRNNSPSRPEGITSKKVLSGVGADRYGSVSRDGRFLSFMDTGTGDLAVRDLTTGEDRRLTNNPAGSKEFAEYSVFSPDGTRLAYGWYNARSEYELRVINRDGGEPRQLHANPGTSWLMPYDWSPDGREILTILPRPDRTRQLVLVSVSDGTVRILKTLAWNMGVPSRAEFSANGRLIAYDRRSAEFNSDADVFLLAVDGTREAALASGPGDDTFLGWLPGGEAVLFSSDRSGTLGAWCVTLDDRGPKGDPWLLKPDIGRLDSKGVTRNGEFFHFKNVGGPDIHLAEMEPASGRVTRAPAPLRRPADGRMLASWSASWSPDGEHLVYRVAASRPVVVAVHNVKTDIVRTIPLQMNYLGPSLAWTKDGGLLVVGSDEHARQGIFRVALGTGAVEPVLPDSAIAGMALFSPDEKFLVYSHLFERPEGQKRVLVARTMATGETRELFSGSFAGGFVMSPDGQFLAVRAEEPRSVRVVDVSRGTSRILLTLGPEDAAPVLAMAWTPDGSAMLLVRGAGSNELWRVRVSDGHAEKLDLKLPGMTRVSVNRDGRRLALVAAQQTPELWVLQNVQTSR